MRQAVGDSGAAQSIVRTYSRRGFRFVADIKADGESAAQEEPTSGPGPPAQQGLSIAVMALENLSDDPGRDYLAHGLTQDIITELTRFRELLVIAPNSSLRRHHGASQREVGKELGVRYVVSGSLRSRAGTLRIAVQLTEVETGRQFWSEHYDAPLEDIFELEDKITHAIASVVSGKLDEAVARRAARTPASDLGAYDLLLRARWLYWRGADDKEVLSVLEEVLDRDPTCAAAHALAGLVTGYAGLASGRPSQPSAAAFRNHVETALALDDRDALIQALAGMAYLFAGEHERALQHARMAVQLNPNSTDVIHYHAIVLGACGHPEEALDWHARAIRLDPLHSPEYFEPMIEANYLLERYDQAIELFHRWRNPPAHVCAEVAACFAQKGDDAGCRSAVARFEATRPADFDFQSFLSGLLAYHSRTRDRDHWRQGFLEAGLLT